MPPKIGPIVETILYTSDVPALAKWYKDVLGLSTYFEASSCAGFYLPNDRFLLLFDRTTTTKDKVLTGSTSGLIPKHGTERGLGQHIAFACSCLAEVREWERHFAENGVDVIGKVDWERGGMSVYVKDWEGHVVEITSRGFRPVY